MSMLDRLENNHILNNNNRSSEPLPSAAPLENNLDNKIIQARAVISQIEQNIKKIAVAEPFAKRDNQKGFLKEVLEIHRQLVNNAEIDISEINLFTEDAEEQKKNIKTLDKQILSIIEAFHRSISRKEMGEIIEAVKNETVGLGPIEPLIHDDTITEIMVNGCDNVYAERGGHLEKTNIVFYDDEHVKRIILRIVSRIGRRIDESMPMVDARLKDGSRVNAIIPPVSLTGPILTIRKFADKKLSSKDMIRLGSINSTIEEFLKICVQARMNIIVSGGTGSGKTTLLNMLSGFIPNTERIITIEDSAELKMHQEHVVTLETRPPNIENTGEVTIRDLVRISLRMRPDRIIVGEVRGGECLDMLQAMNTGHDGSMTTAHANSPRDLILRLETMVLMAGVDIQVKAIRQQIASGFNLIIQQSRMQDGSRKITKITEICGMEEDTIVLKDIFVYKQTSFNEKTNKIEGEFSASGLMPSFVNKLETHGLKFPKDMFRAKVEN
jgi:pilus assembly protein CpaF